MAQRLLRRKRPHPFLRNQCGFINCIVNKESIMAKKKVTPVKKTKTWAQIAVNRMKRKKAAAAKLAKGFKGKA